MQCIPALSEPDVYCDENQTSVVGSDQHAVIVRAQAMSVSHDVSKEDIAIPQWNKRLACGTQARLQ